MHHFCELLQYCYDIFLNGKLLISIHYKKQRPNIRAAVATTAADLCKYAYFYSQLKYEALNNYHRMVKTNLNPSAYGKL